MMGEIFGAIARYGIGPVIVGVIVYLLIVLHNRIAERKRKTQEEKDKREMVKLEKEEELKRQELEKQREIERQKIEAEKEAKIMSMIKEIVIQTINPPHTAEEQRESRKENQFIAHQLDCLVNEGADRAYMFSFHNGGKDLLGRGFLKMSMTQESIGENIAPIMAEYQAMPRMLFPKLYEELDEKDYYNVDDIKTIEKTDQHTYQFLIQHGVKTALFRPIKNEDGLMIGFVGVEYINSPCEDKKKASKNIDKKANRIMGALLGQSNE